MSDVNIKGEVLPKANVLALIPFVVFVVFYVGLSIWANDFYKVPMPIAFLVASAVALALGKKKLNDKIDDYARGMGDTNIMIMCLIFILSGAFATVAKEMGAVNAAVEIARAFIPVRLLVAGSFVIACLISLSIGTSCGTIAALVPIAIGLVESLNINPALIVSAVVGGAMFGDNMSMISDTTIAATRTQNIEMKEKFFANLWISLPAAIAAFVVYCIVGSASGEAALEAVTLTWHHALLVLPYILILVLALCGLNVMLLLFSGVVMSSIIGLCLGSITFWGALESAGKGALGMSETLIVAILAGGLLTTIRHNGGISWLIDMICKMVKGVKGCELGVFLLVSAVNVFTANNTVAIVIAGPIAKDISDKFDCAPSRIASILDAGSCVIQGLIPYGAQILIAVSLSKIGEKQVVNAVDMMSCFYYQFFLALLLVVSIFVRFAKTRKA